MAVTSTPAVAKSLSLTDAITAPVAKSALPYTITSETAPVAGGGVTGRGVNVKSGAEYFIFQEGRQQQALTFQTVAALIAHHVITVQEIVALLAAVGVKLAVVPEEKK